MTENLQPLLWLLDQGPVDEIDRAVKTAVDLGDAAPSIAAVMEKGDAIIFSGKIVHGGGANISNRPRRALTLAFCPGWLVPEEAYPFAIPLEMARTLSKRGQQLTGFRSMHNQKMGGGTLWSLDYIELARVLELD